MKKPKVALVHNATPSEGGSFTYESNISIYLHSELGQEFDFVDLYKGTKNSVLGRKGTYRSNPIRLFFSVIRQFTLGYEILRHLRFHVSKFEKFISLNNFDYVYFLSPNPEAMSIMSVPMLNTVWDLGHRHFPELSELSFDGSFQKREFFYSSVLARSFHVVVDSEKTKSELSKFYGVKSSRVTSLGLFPCKFEHECSSECENGEYIFYPAQFWSHKNHETLVKAFKVVREINPALELYLSGTDKGTQSSIKELISREDLTNSVKFLGFVSLEDMARYYKHARFVAFPSRLGHTNLPPLESLLLGTPVIASDVHSYDFEIPENYLLKVPSLDVEKWTEAMRQILSRPKIVFTSDDLPTFIPDARKVREIFSQIGSMN